MGSANSRTHPSVAHTRRRAPLPYAQWFALSPLSCVSQSHLSVAHTLGQVPLTLSATKRGITRNTRLSILNGSVLILVHKQGYQYLKANQSLLPAHTPPGSGMNN